MEQSLEWNRNIEYYFIRMNVRKKQENKQAGMKGKEVSYGQ